MLTLHWQALHPPHADLHVFTHLVDPARSDTPQGIIAQVDRTPMNGTRPFWVWAPDEVNADSVALTVPSGTPPGNYLLLMGIYDAGSGRRLPITHAADFGSNRLMVATITVR
jgi:hypothetical protein